MAQFKSYAMLLNDIKQLCDEKHTGTIFITTDDEHLIRFVLQDGEITALAFDASYNNHDAVQHVRQIKSGKLQFAAHIFNQASEVPLSNTQTLLDDLASQQNSSNNQIQANVVAELVKLLAEYIGPFAQFSCDDYTDAHGIPDDAVSLQHMIDALLHEIDTASEQAAFKLKAMALLKTVGKK